MVSCSALCVHAAGGDRNAENAPCNTLFIGNLSPAVGDTEIENYFRNLKGDAFVTCKVNRSNPSRVSAFVQFADIEAATEVHTSQQVCVPFWCGWMR